jgi:mannosyltransferase OCH1-like enzyme
MVTFPKIIHQIWLQGQKDIPRKFNNNTESIKKMHSKWLYILWDGIMILKLMNIDKKLLKTYYKLIYLHQKVDFARYVILYLYGGVYLDIDIEAIKPLDDILDKYKNYDLIVSKLSLPPEIEFISCTVQGRCINNGIIIAKPKAKVLLNLIKHVIDNCKCCSMTNKMICIETTTGPVVFSKIIKNFPDSSKIKILDPEYFEPCLLDKCQITSNTYLLHKHNVSWFSDEFKFICKFYLNNRVQILFVLLLLIIILALQFI